MSLKVISLVRVSPEPCQHFEVTVDDNGVVSSAITYIPANPKEMEEIQLPELPRGVLVSEWIKDQVNRGETLEKLVDVEIEHVLPK